MTCKKYDSNPTIDRLATSKKNINPTCSRRCGSYLNDKKKEKSPSEILRSYWNSDSSLYTKCLLSTASTEDTDRPLTAPTESLLIPPIQRPLTANVKIYEDRQLLHAKIRHRRAEGRVLLEPYLKPKANYAVDTPAIKNFKKHRTKVEQVATRLTRANTVALRGLMMSRNPTAPTFGSHHFSYLTSEADFAEGAVALPKKSNFLNESSLSNLMIQLSKRKCRFLDLSSSNLCPEEVNIVFGILLEHPTIQIVDIGQNIVTAASLRQLSYLVTSNDNVIEIHNGITPSGAPLLLPSVVINTLQRNVMLKESRIAKENHLLKLKSQSVVEIVAQEAIIGILSDEWVSRRVIINKQENKREILRNSKKKNFDVTYRIVYKRKQKHDLQIRLSTVNSYESITRPSIEGEALCSILHILDYWQENELEQIIKDENQLRTVLRKVSFESWEKHYKREKQRHQEERIQRNEFEVGESQDRVAVAGEEFESFKIICELCNEDWTAVDRIIQTKTQKEEEERRRIQQKQAEEERERQWKRERQKKEEERLRSERQKAREKLMKDEKRVRVTIKKAEEPTRALLRELHDVTADVSQEAGQLTAALKERLVELQKPPEISISFENQRGDYLTTYFENSFSWIKIIPDGCTLHTGFSSESRKRIETLEKTAIKHARSEALLRYELNSKIETIQNNTNTLLKNAEVEVVNFEEQEPPQHQVNRLFQLVRFPPLSDVIDEKLRIWSGVVEFDILRDSEKPGPHLSSDRLQVENQTSENKWIIDQDEERLSNLSIQLRNTADLTKQEMCDCASSVVYNCVAEPVEPFARIAQLKISLSMLRSTDHKLLTDDNNATANVNNVVTSDYIRSIFSDKNDRIPICRSDQPPNQSDLLKVTETYNCFIACVKPYISLGHLMGPSDRCSIISVPFKGNKKRENSTALLSSLTTSYGVGVADANTSSVSVKRDDRTIPQFNYLEPDCAPVSLTPFGITVNMPPFFFYKAVSLNDGQAVCDQPKRRAEIHNSGGSFAGGSLSVSFLEGYSPADVLLLNLSSSCFDFDPFSKQLMDDGTPVGKFLTGLKSWESQSTDRFATQNILCSTEKAEQCEISKQISIELFSDISTIKLQSLISCFLYCNETKDPLIGKRLVQIELYDSRNVYFATEFLINVLWHDVPPKLIIEESKQCYRTPCQSDVHESHLNFIERNSLPIMGTAKLVDPDTHYFCGGFLVVSIAHSENTTDGLLINESPNKQLGICISETKIKSGNQEEEKSQLQFNGTPFGRVTFNRNSDACEPTEIAIDFMADGSATIVAVDNLLRSICFYTTELCNIPQGIRHIDVNLLIGPTMLKKDVFGNIIEHDSSSISPTPLTAALQVRICPPVIRVPQKHVNMKYMEGSGVKRLGPFDLCSDEDFGSKDWSGYLKAEVIDGGEEGDFLSVREENGIRTFRVSEITSDQQTDFAQNWRHRPSSVADLDVELMQALMHKRKSRSSVAGVSFKKLGEDSSVGENRDTTTSALTREGRAMSLVLQNKKPSIESNDNETNPSNDDNNPANHSETTPADNTEVNQPTEELQPVDPKEEVQRTPSFNVKERVRGRIRDVAVRNLASRRNHIADAFSGFMDKVRDRKKGIDSRFRKGRATKSEVQYEDSTGHRHIIGTLFVSPKGALLIQLNKKLKRSYLLAALKSIAFSHESNNPTQLDKKVCKIYYFLILYKIKKLSTTKQFGAS